MILYYECESRCSPLSILANLCLCLILKAEEFKVKIEDPLLKCKRESF